MNLKKLLLAGMSALMLVGCASQNQSNEIQEIGSEEQVTTLESKNITGEESDVVESSGEEYPEGEDVRRIKWKHIKELSEEGLSKELISTYWFNEGTDFKSFEQVADEIMEEGKNPGLGVRALHEKGITGKGVNVAIIDQPIEVNHPEYKGKIVEYKNLCDEDGGESSMHGPAVASLLAGNTIGVAPEVNIYYVAAPSWTGDAAYQAEALKWIIERNKALSQDNKIHVVSISAAPSGEGSPFDKNNKQWDEAVELAAKEDILVLDCTTTYGKIGPCYYDGKDRENPSTYKAGFPREVTSGLPKELILAPVGSRTTAETYEEGVYSYQYDEHGGLSWGIPYAAGTLALGWQIDPTLTAEEMMNLLDENTTLNQEGYKIINPVKFAEAIQARLK